MYIGSYNEYENFLVKNEVLVFLIVNERENENACYDSYNHCMIWHKSIYVMWELNVVT
jgi:hypothetical protein